MDETEVAVRLEAHEQRIDSLKRRTDDLETGARRSRSLRYRSTGWQSA